MPLLKKRENEVLHRKSFRILRFLITTGFGMVAIGLLISLTRSFKGGPLMGVAACCLTIAVAQRLMGSRIILLPSVMTVVNPLRNYVVPYDAVTNIRGGGGSALILTIRGGDEIHSAGFSGSLIDGILKTADRSIERIEAHTRESSRSTHSGQVAKSFRVSPVADFAALCAVICAAVAGVAGI